jgi:DNA-directed RNA polymerase I, II, and III subunit RPABC2
MEQLRFNSRVIHPEVQSVGRQAVTDSLKGERITTPYYTKYEYTTLIGTRAQQIAEGSKPLIALDGMITSDPQFVWNVAEKEVAQKKLPFIIHRRLPSGTSEYWSAQELDIMW